MKYAETQIGRIFVIRLEHGDKLPDIVEEFAREKGVSSGCCLFLGGIQDRSELVIGPEQDNQLPPVPMHHLLSGTHEVVGVGTLFPDEQGHPRLHGHAAAGRKESTITGCIRPGILAWTIVEFILLEFAIPCGTRVYDPGTELKLLQPGT